MNLNDLPKYMLICLLLTIIFEIVIGLIIGIRDKKDILNIVLVNMLTNPLVTSIPTALVFFVSTLVSNISLVILEILAVVIEGFIYKRVLKYKRINPYLVSLILNIGSYLLGLIVL